MDLWQYLTRTDKHVVMYGMGDGADKILGVCERYGIVVEDFFASDEFVRGQSFHGMRVCTLSELGEKYGYENMVVLVAFASARPEVMANISRVASLCETYVPDVPVKGNTLFCEEYEQANRAKMDAACAALADERSRQVFRGVLEFRRFGRLDVLERTADEPQAVMSELLHTQTYTGVVDAGAYDGDTARLWVSRCPNLKQIWAFEPDRRNFRKLEAYAKGETSVCITPIQAALWNEKAVLRFDDSGNRNAGVDQEELARRHVQVQAVALDDLLAGERVDFIKYDIEGSEREALWGSERIIREQKPDLLVSLYHRTEDLHELILLIREICPEYRLFVRRYPYIPAWDLNLYATVK